MTEPVTRSRLLFALAASLALHLLLGSGLSHFDHEAPPDRTTLIQASLIPAPPQPVPVAAQQPPPAPEPQKSVPRPPRAKKAPATEVRPEPEPEAPAEKAAAKHTVAPEEPADEAEAADRAGGDAGEERRDLGEDASLVAGPDFVLTPSLALVGEARLEFDVFRGESLVIGETRYHWVHDGQHYQMETSTETTGLAALLRPLRIDQRSEGDLLDTGLRPQRYVSRPTQGKGTEEEVVFDWKANQVMLRAGSKQSGHDLVAGAQDMASLWLELMWRAQSAGGEFDFMVATGKRYTPRWFVPEQNTDSLDTAVGRLLVKRLQARAQPGDNQIEVWLAPNLRWLPVRIRYTDRKGDVYDQRVRMIEYENVSLRAKVAAAANAVESSAEPSPTPAAEPANPFLR
jgi:hypothetical protein